MGVEAMIHTAIGKAFEAVGDIAKPVTLVHVNANPTYNPATGVSTPATTSYVIKKAVLTKFKVYEVDNVAIKATDRKLLFQNFGVIPQPGVDTIIDDIGNIWNIINPSAPPSMGMWTLQLRRS